MGGDEEALESQMEGFSINQPPTLIAVTSC